ncbi:MAG: hypothetical protein ABFC57_12540 [Veillonellales bacterium]
MFTILTILVVGYVVYRIFFSRPRYNSGMNPMGYNGGGFGRGRSLFTGMILGYLLDHYLINQSQYDMWQNLGMDELRDTLTAEGIVSDTDFDSLADQASEGQLSYNDNQQSNDMGWNTDDSGFDNSNDYDDFNDGGGFGGSDF